MKKIVLLVAGMVAVAGLAWAAEGEKHMRPPKEDFAAMDTNNDGSVSKDEYIAAQTKMIEHRFSMIDENGDGKLSKEELESARDRMQKAWREHRKEKDDN